MTKDQMSLQAEVFSPQAWVQSESHCFIGGTPFGVAEAMWIMEGSYIIAGVKLEEVSGAHLNNKIEYLHGMQGIDDFLKKICIYGKGFWYQHDEPTTVLLVHEATA